MVFALAICCFFNVLTLLYRKNKLVKTYKMFLIIVIIKRNEIINK